MNKLKELFKNKNKDILSIYFTAGHPYLDSTAEIIESLQQAKVDFVEVGMPFSDPMADGSTIQKSSEIALENGMNLDVYFQQLKSIKQKINMPLIAMGYVNQMMCYGVDKFLKACKNAGVSGLIFPDLPLKVYKDVYEEKFQMYDMANIFLVTPQTSYDRIKKIDEISNSFIYVVSSASTTGAKSTIGMEQIEYFDRLKQMKLKNPLIVGFGISNRETYLQVCKYASGAIIGSSFVNAISEKADNSTISKYVKQIKNDFA